MNDLRTRAAARLVGLPVVLLSVLVIKPAAQAECAVPTISVWPTRSMRLPSLPEVVVHTSSEDDVGRLAQATFVAGAHIVRAKVLASHGSFGPPQVVLRAASPLHPGKLYALRIPARDEPLGTWMVDADMAKTPPRLDGSPVVTVSPRVMLGCGDARPVLLSGLLTDPATTLEVTLVGPDKKIARQRLVRLKRGSWDIGYGMCGGAFLLGDDVTYEGRAVAVDMAGNRSAEVRFTFSTTDAQ